MAASLREGPEIERLLQRLARCPREFLQAGTEDGSDALAIICDQMRRVIPNEPPELSPHLPRLRSGSTPHQSLLAIVGWLLYDDWFLQMPELGPAMWQLYTSPKLIELSKLLKPELFVFDADRREELTRFCLQVMALLPRGETNSYAKDRLTTLDTIERNRVLRATAAAERRAREVREAMARAKAQESASRYGE